MLALKTTVAVVLLVYAGGESDKVASARKMLAEGSRELAGRTLEEAIRANPNDGPAHLLLGEMLEEDNRPADALETLTTAEHLMPSSAEAHNARGEALSDLNSLKAARSEFEKALQLNPLMAMAHLNLGMVLAQTDDLAQAAKHLDFAIAKLNRPEDLARAHYLRAKVYSSLSQTEQASTELHIAVKLAPDFAEAWSDLGQARKTLLDDAGALADFERAAGLNPSDPVVQTRLGVELYQQGKSKAAIVELEKADQTHPKDQTTLNTLLSALRAEGRIEEANAVKARLVEVLRERDQNTQNQMNADRLSKEGANLAKQGDVKGAVVKFRQAAELDPDQIEIRVNLAAALFKAGEWHEGFSQLAEAMQREPGNPAVEAAWQNAIRQAPPGSWVHP